METYHKSIPSGAQFYKEYLSWKSSSGFVYTSTSRNIYIVCEYVNTHTHTHTYGASLVAQMVKHLFAMQETRIWSLGCIYVYYCIPRSYLQNLETYNSEIFLKTI